jgi:transcriptional regulator with GAF, ATPase, and Fis domain
VDLAMLKDQPGLLAARICPRRPATDPARDLRRGVGKIFGDVRQGRRHILVKGASVARGRQPDLSRLLAQIAEAPGVDGSIDQIVAFTAQTFDTDHAGVTLIRDRGRRFETAGPTSPVVREADELQDRLRQGPCVDAAVESRSVVSHAVARDPRWPAWGPRVARLGLASVLSSELHAGGTRIGALNVYAGRDRQFTHEDVEVGRLLAQHASVALKFVEQIDGLNVALDSRTLIGQAQGMLMERYGIDAEGAFAAMKRVSQDENVRLVTVAKSIVDGTYGL